MRQIAILLFLLVACVTSSANPKDSHRAAAAELLLLTGVDEVMGKMASTMTEAMVVSNPLLQPYQSVLRDWSNQTITWENFETRFVDAYVDAFTETELREMIAFYETPTGKKAIRLQPELMQKGMEFGQAVALEHQDELKQMLEKRKAEIDALNSKGEE